MKVSIICFTHNTPLQLQAFISMLQLQTYKDWELIVMDESDETEFKRNDNFLYIPSDKLKRNIKKRGCKLDYQRRRWQKDWGQTSKEEAAKKFANGELLAFPNDDSYWTPVFLEKSVKKAKEGYDLILTDWLWNQNSYNVVVARPAVGKVDVGGFLLKREKFLKVGWKDKDSCGDGKLVERLIASGVKWTKINGINYVKN